MENLLTRKKGQKKDGGTYYMLIITHVYASGKRYIERIFLNENEYNSLDYIKEVN